MLCPQCGYDVGNEHRCKRCGYEIKTLATVDESRQKEEQNEPETKIIDPSDTYISSEYGTFDSFVSSDPFDALFGSIFDPIGDLLGGLFGFDVSPFGRGSGTRVHVYDDDKGKAKPKKSGKVVEVDHVEILDENGNPIDAAGKIKHKHKTAEKRHHHGKKSEYNDKDD